MSRLENRIEKLKRTTVYDSTHAVAAYVVFNHEEAVLRCLEDYEGSDSFIKRFFQPPPLRFRRIHGLEVPISNPCIASWCRYSSSDTATQHAPHASCG